MQTLDFSQKIAGRYQPLEWIGEGSMGKVLLAGDEKLDGRQVAIKFLSGHSLELTPDALQRFRQEMHNLIQMERHPNVVQVYDIGDLPDGTPYLVTSFIRGGSLQQRLQSHAWPDLVEVERILQNLCAALETMHSRGIIHRDLKPANILIDAPEPGHWERILVSDFGISILADSETPAWDSSAAGTPGYRAPEQRQGGGKIDQRVDIYALGVIAWQFYTRQEPPIDPAAVPEKLPERLQAVLLKALAASPAERYATVAEFRQAWLEAPAPPDFSPYKGLQTYQEEDADLFFGREAQVTAMLAYLETHHFMAVVGPSGVGKSSLVRAGLIPALKDRWTSYSVGQENHRLFVITPGQNPLEALASTLNAGVQPETGQLVAAMLADPGALESFLRALSSGPARHHVWLVIDQFEQLSLFSQESERESFLENITHALAQTDGILTVIITLRADFYDRFSGREYAALRELLQDNQILLGEMNDAELRAAIQKPGEAPQWQLTSESGLVELILQDAREPGALPLLSQALLETWQRRRGRGLTVDGYQQAGGVKQAIATAAGRVYSQLTSNQQAIARRIFLRQIQFGEGRANTRRQQRVEDLMSSGESGSKEDFDAVLQTLVNGRLLTLSQEPGSNRRRVDLAHEALIAGWPQLQQWIQVHRESEFTRRRLESKAAEWVRLGRDVGGLLDEVEIGEAQRWLSSPDAAELGYSQDLPQLVQASQAALAQTRQREQRRTRTALGIVSIFLVIAIIAAIFGFAGQNRARQAAYDLETQVAVRSTAEVEALNAEAAAVSEGNIRATAERSAQEAKATAIAESYVRATAQAEAETQSALAFSRQLAAQAELVYNQRPAQLDLAVLLSAESLRRVPTQAGDITMRSLLSLFPRQVARLNILPANTNSSDTDVEALAYSPDGKWLAAGTLGEVIQIWDTSKNKIAQRILAPKTGGVVPSVRTLAFSPDSRWLVSGQDNGTAYVWEVTTGKQIQVKHHPDQVFSVAFSPTENLIASSSVDGTFKLWEAETGQERLSLKAGHSIEHLRFSPNGALIAAAGGNSITVWQVDNGQQLVQKQQFTDNGSMDNRGIQALVFSPDSQQIATGEGDASFSWLSPRPVTGGKILVWQVTTGQEIASLQHDDAITSLDFSPDGKWLASGSVDGTARVWDIAAKKELNKFTLGTAANLRVNAVKLMMQGQWLIVAGNDGQARIWDIKANGLLQRLPTSTDHQLLAIAKSTDEKRIAIGDNSGWVWIWEPAGHETALINTHAHRNVSWLQFDRQGKRLLVGTFNKLAQILDTSNWEEISHIEHADRVVQAVFSPDEQLVASASQDGVIKVWEASTGRQMFEVTGIQPFSMLTFSPDGKWLAASQGVIPSYGWISYRMGVETHPSDVILWSVATGKEAMRFKHDGWVSSVAFSPDSIQLLTAGEEAIARIWDIASGKELRRVSHGNRINRAIFSPDGALVASVESCLPPQSTFGGGYECKPVLKVWETATGKERWQTVLNGWWAAELLFTPDGRYIATSISDFYHGCARSTCGEVHILETETGKEVAQAKHTGYITALAVSQDGNRLAFGSTNNVLAILAIPSGEELVRINFTAGEDSEVWAASFSPDGQWVAAGGYEAGDVSIHVFPLEASALVDQACKRLTRNLSLAEWKQYLPNYPYRATCENLPPDIPQANGYSNRPAISADGRYVVFSSTASNLVCDDSNSSEDVFLYDREANTLRKVSVSTGGQQGNNVSGNALISSDGRYIAFESSATNLVDNDSNKVQDVFLHDQLTGQTILASKTFTGTQTNGFSRLISLSPDGRYVAFYTSATNFPGLSRSHSRILLYDAQKDIVIISQKPDPFSASISADGSLETGANFLEGDGESGEYELQEVYLLDHTTDKQRYISISPDGKLGNHDSDYASITPDGKLIVFASESNNLVSGDENGAWDIFLYNLQNASLQRVSFSYTGEEADGQSEYPSISADGRFIVFTSTATNLVPNDTNELRDVFMLDRLTGVVMRISIPTICSIAAPSP